MKSLFVKTASTATVLFLTSFACHIRSASAQQQASTIAISESSEKLVSQNFRVDSGGFPLVPVATFTVMSKGSENIMANFDVDILGSNSVRVIYLFEGNTQVTAGGASDNHSDNLFMGVRMLDGEKRTFTILVQFYNDVARVSPLAQARVTNFRYYNSNFQLRDAVGTIIGLVMHLFDKCAQWSLASSSSIAIDQSVTKVRATFPLNAKALAGAVTAPSASDFSAKFIDIETGESRIATEISVATTPAVPIADGTTKPVTVTATLSGPGLKADGLYHAHLDTIKWTVAGNQTIQTWGLDRMVTGITNAVLPEADAIGLLGSRLNAADQSQSAVLAIAAPHQNFFAEISQDLSTWIEHETPAVISEVAVLPNGAKAYRMLLPSEPVMNQSARMFYRATLQP